MLPAQKGSKFKLAGLITRNKGMEREGRVDGGCRVQRQEREDCKFDVQGWNSRRTCNEDVRDMTVNQGCGEDRLCVQESQRENSRVQESRVAEVQDLDTKSSPLLRRNYVCF